MNAGRLFEAALKDAGIALEAGTELKVRVKDHGKHLRLVVSAAKPSEWEVEILARSGRVSVSKAPYRPELSLGETIRALRKAAGLTVSSLALRARMSKGSLSSIENGRRPAGLLVLKRIAKALGVPASILVK